MQVKDMLAKKAIEEKRKKEEEAAMWSLFEKADYVFKKKIK